MKQFVKSVFAMTPYRIVRDRGANRFQAIEVALSGMKERGFTAGLVIDGGAHLGTFSLAARKSFPAATYHLIEPQTACIPALRSLCAREGFTLHECALADRVGEIGLAQSATPSTGAHVKPVGGSGVSSVPASTLDALLADVVTKDQRALLKLDLQGYELHALRGARRLLSSIEVILTEVSFYAQSHEPVTANIIAFLDASGFQLYDIAALAGRMRDNRLHQGDLVFARKGSQLLADARWD
jgi:FkbM family methyltransferase